MSELRNLLNTENYNELQKRTCGFKSTQWGNGWGNTLLEGFTNYYGGFCFQDNCSNVYRQWCMGYCVVPGVTTVQFEIWGGGGGGAGACCCQQGSPGGSGAYALKTICASDLGLDTLGGFCYLLCIGPNSQCSVNCTGCQGCKTWVTGCGLVNFCAEGGMSGRTCCYIFHDAHGTNLTGCFGPGGNGPSALNSAGCYTLDPVSGCCYRCDCSCYYGADFGVPGRLGWFRVDCICGNNCFVRIGLPQAGGFRDKCTRYVITRNEGNACIHQRTNCWSGEFPTNLDCNSGGMRGQGQMSATSCGGGCCYGWRGSPGLIRITYR